MSPNLESDRHIIRLRGPWQYQPVARTVLLPDGTTRAEPGELPSEGTVRMPADWSEELGCDFFGRVRYVRRFGRPTGLHDTDRIDLVVVQVDAWASVSLNQSALGEIPLAARDTRFDVTDKLLVRNELVVEVELPRETPDSPTLPRGDRAGQAGGLVDEVRLEIRVLRN